MTLTVKRSDVADEMSQSKMAASSNFALGDIWSALYVNKTATQPEKKPRILWFTPWHCSLVLYWHYSHHLWRPFGNLKRAFRFKKKFNIFQLPCLLYQTEIVVTCDIWTLFDWFPSVFIFSTGNLYYTIVEDKRLWPASQKFCFVWIHLPFSFYTISINSRCTTVLH